MAFKFEDVTVTGWILLGVLVVCAAAPKEVQIQRMADRNGFTRAEAVSRIRSQMPVSEKADRSDVVVDTNIPLEQLQQKAAVLYRSWQASAGKEQA